ncbi:hypothetical protein J6N69_05170 [bacterium]|nr:hypothetical protein [bacterium]
MVFKSNMLTISTSKFHSPSFGMYFNDVNDVKGELKYRGDTRLCRDDLDFPAVVNFLEKKYKDVPKVNVVMHACSDGEEVYSFLGVLISKLGEKAAKFLPVCAKDIDSNHLKLAKRGVYNISRSEYKLANSNMNGDFYTYFEPMPKRGSSDPRLKYTTTVKAEHSLKSLINFAQGNILEDIKNTDLKNTVLFARNFWPYLSKDEIGRLVDLLAKNTDASSTVIIGDYDKEYGIDKLLKTAGFVETEVDNVFEKSKINEYKKPKSDIYKYKNFSLYNL